jgi:ribose transport system substrate-binding protein
MLIARRRTARALALTLVVTGVLAGCSHGSGAIGMSDTAAERACREAVTAAKANVTLATNTKARWLGPSAGQAAVPGKTLVYVAQTLANPGVAGNVEGVQEAAAVIGWQVRVIDGHGDPAGIAAAMDQAIGLRPDGIVIGGFDPGSVGAQIDHADAAGIPLVGWHALAAPGPSSKPKLFSNVTTNVEDVAKISADYIIATSNGVAGVVIFTDNSIPFAAGKAIMIETALKTCNSVKVLQVSDIPIPDAANRAPQEFSSLASRLSGNWTHSVAINDLYFDNAAAPLRAAGKSGDGQPFNIGAGDGSKAAFQRIASGQYQMATVPEPLAQEGWQIVDEFNRAFAGAPASGYVPAVHVTDRGNVGATSSWDPDNGYRDAYRRIWGR